MKSRRFLSCNATALVVLLVLAPSAQGQVQVQEQEKDQAQAQQQADAAGPVIQTPGDGVSTVHLVDHGDSWSMHVENVPTNQVLNLWQRAGGPELVAKTVIDRPYTLSVHRLSAERILERLFDGYDYTLHYDGRGRLVRVRVYSLDPAAVFKTPRLVESLRQWTDRETRKEEAGETAPDGGSGTTAAGSDAAGE